MQLILPALYPIINCDEPDQALILLKKLLPAKPSLLQLRAKRLSDQALSRLISRLQSEFDSEAQFPKIIINDRLSLAFHENVVGIHLGQDDLDPRIAREKLSASAIIGYSTHTLEQIELAQSLPVDYLGFGPVFLSSTKQGHAKTTGLSLLKQAVTLSKLPVVAIGGITLENVAKVYSTGTKCVASISDLALADNPALYFQAYETAYKNCLFSS